METEYISSQLIDPVLYIQEQERKRISEALHNELGQILYTIQLTLSRLDNSGLSEDNQKIKEEVKKLVTEGIMATRRVSYELMPTMLKDYGLKASLEEMVRRLSGKIKFHTIIEVKKRYKDNFEISLFRIIQELVNNVIKHSGADVAKIYLYEDNQNVIVEVSDNGIGIADDNKRKDGMGLHFIKGRAQQLNGMINIQSSKGKGTVITIKIPLL